MILTNHDFDNYLGSGKVTRSHNGSCTFVSIPGAENDPGGTWDTVISATEKSWNAGSDTPSAIDAKSNFFTWNPLLTVGVAKRVEKWRNEVAIVNGPLEAIVATNHNQECQGDQASVMDWFEHLQATSAEHEVLSGEEKNQNGNMDDTESFVRQEEFMGRKDLDEEGWELTAEEQAQCLTIHTVSSDSTSGSS